MITHELPKGLINWYHFKENASVLFVSASENKSDPLLEVLLDKGLKVCAVTLNSFAGLRSGSGNYDYVILKDALERCAQPEQLLAEIRKCMSEEGILLFGMNNRLGIRYFCGDRDLYTERILDGLENYCRVPSMMNGKEFWGRTYSKDEMIRMLENTGFTQHRFYSVLPDLVMPQVFYAEDYLPEEALEIRIIPEYNSPDTIFLEEERLYSDLINNGLFHAMANAYLVECPLDGKFANVKHVTTSMDRGRERALATIIGRDGTVIKRALYPEGESLLRNLVKHASELRNRGVKMVEGKMIGKDYVMPYIHAETATDYFRRLLRQDATKFLEEIALFWEIILRSSEQIPYEQVDWEHFDPDWERRKEDDPYLRKWKEIAFGNHSENIGPILKQGYIDLVCLNCFRIGEEFVFFDQEFCFPQIPAYTILSRTIDLVYAGVGAKEITISRKDLLERYHLAECEDLWARGSAHFTDVLRNVRELREFHQSRRRDSGVVNSNRQRISYSEAEYHRLFVNILKNTIGRKVFLFGSGQYAERFFVRFGNTLPLEGILDNNEQKWGTQLSGVTVMDPQILKKLSPDEYKVIICMKNYQAVVKQLRALGTKEYGIFDWSIDYPRAAYMDEIGKKASGAIKEEIGAVNPDIIREAVPKKYHTGYVAGVFDLFHMGHLNLLRRAKEQCDYLIVGIVSDEAVRRNKGTNPVIPFEERIEIVRACRYVDEAVGLPVDYGDTDEAYRKYHFDVQFSGSDYENDPDWLAKREFLRKHGSDLVFFPYTESTSSTKLKELINRKLV